MRHSLSLAILLGITTLFQGCGDTDEPQAATVSTTITGSTTLASGLRTESKSTVCLDLNDNTICDSEEPSAQTDIAGKYSLTVPSSVADGTIIIVEGGIDLLPLTTAQDELKFIKYYQRSEGDQNINILSTLIVEEMALTPDNSYNEVKANIANRYSLNENDVDADPFVVQGDFLNRVIGLQALNYNQTLTAASPAPALNRVSEADTAPTGDALDDFVSDNASLLDEYLTLLGEYLDAIADWYNSLWEDDEEVIVEVPVVDTPVEEEITRDILNGVWYIIDASGDKTCSYIEANDDISVTEADGGTTDLSLDYDNTAKSMELSLGFFTADTIFFDKYMSNLTFEGHYGSDGETLDGVKMGSLSECKSDKLGL